MKYVSVERGNKMCLDEIQKIELNSDSIYYKIVRKEKGKLYLPYCGKRDISLPKDKVLYEMDYREKLGTDGMLTLDSINKYPTGFHVYKYITEAESQLSPWNDDHVIVKVICADRDIVATGIQSNCDALVSKRIQILGFWKKLTR
jgi:hypothetical protein